MNVRGVQTQTAANQTRIEELLSEIKRLERRIQIYEKGFSASNCLRKSSKGNSGYNFDRWLEDARQCTLRSIPVKQVQPNVKQDQGNWILNDCVYVNCQKFGHTTSICPNKKIFTLVEKEDKLFKD